MPRPHRTVRLAALAVPVLVAAGLAACGDDAATSQSTTTDPPTTTTTVATTTTKPEPVRIVVAGDSIAYDLAPAVAAALDPGSATVEWMVAPAIAKDSVRSAILLRLDADPADVLVVMVGIWERAYRTSAGLVLGDPGWVEAYTAEVLVPLHAELERRGTHLVLLRPPPIREPDDDAQLTALAVIWRAFAAAHPDTVTFADAGTWLGGAGYQEFVAGGDGQLLRARRTDGIHLCAEGAIRLARGVAALVSAEDRSVPYAPAWEQGAWTARFPVDECPPVTG